MHKELARIEDTMLGIEDHGILTAMLYVKYEGSSFQGIGGYSLDNWNKDKKERIGTAYGMEFIKRILEACRVAKWEDLKGKTIYALKESDKWGAKVVGIGPLGFEGSEKDNFIFDDLYAEFGEA